MFFEAISAAQKSAEKHVTLYGPKCVEINIWILFLIDNLTFSTLTNALSCRRRDTKFNVSIHLCLWLLKQLKKII